MAFRKKVVVFDPNAPPPPPPVPGSAASIPKRPQLIDAAVLKLRDIHSKNTNVTAISAGYGLDDNGDSDWRIFIFLDDIKLKSDFDFSFDGFPFAFRNSPVALKGPSWGRRDKKIRN